MPMPLDVLINYSDGTYEIQYIPISLMRGEKKNPYSFPSWSVKSDWAWSMPEYLIVLDHPKNEIVSIIIDPTGYMADVNRSNNEFFKPLEANDKEKVKK